MSALWRLCTASALLSLLLRAHSQTSDKPPCVPTRGKTGLILGQDWASIGNYTAAFPLDTHTPFGYMAYTAITFAGLENGTNLLGLRSPVDYGSGIEWTKGLLDTYANSSLNLGLYMVDSSAHIMDGALDEDIDRLAHFLKRYPSRSIYLRVGYEFDSAENHYPTEEYIGAFRRISDRLDAAGVTNTALVWHASGFAPRDGRSLDEWFPGRQYVDWCGVSLFQQPYDCQSSTADCRFVYAEKLTNFCNEMSIPVMIAESTPFGGLIDEGNSEHGPNRAGYEGSSWNRWFVPVLGFIEKNNIRIWSYIDCDWDSFPMWQRNRAPGVHWGDSRVESMRDLRRRWREEVLETTRFSWTSDPEERKLVCSVSSEPRGANRTDTPKRQHSRATLKPIAEALIAFALVVLAVLWVLDCFLIIPRARSYSAYTIID